MAHEQRGRPLNRSRNESVNVRQNEEAGQQYVQQPTSTRLSQHGIAQTLPRHFDAASMQQSNLAQQRMPIPMFPNPHPPSQPSMQYSQTFPSSQDVQQMQSNSGKVLRRKQPFDVLQAIPPPTPPLAVPGASAGKMKAQPKISTVRSHYRAPPSPLGNEVQNTKQEEEQNSGSDESEGGARGPKEDLRWSSDESTPTPTASSVAAASARRRQEATTMMPVSLVAPTQVARARGLSTSQQQPSIQPTPKPDPSSIRPVSASSVTLSSGQQVPAVRTDFENMKKITRPGSSSKTTNTSNSQISASVGPSKQQEEKGKGREIDDEAAAQQTAPVQVVVVPQSILKTTVVSDPKRSVAAQLESYEPHQMTPVQEEEEEEHQQSIRRVSNSNAMRVMQGVTGEIATEDQQAKDSAAIRSRRLSRGSFESGTTALDTPRIIDEDGRTSFEMMRTGSGEILVGRDGGNDTVGRHATSKALQTHRAIVQGLVAPPSDVMEVQEPSGSNGISQTKGDTPRSHGISSHLEQLNKFINTSIGQPNRQSQTPKSDAGKKGKADAIEKHDHVKDPKRPNTGDSFQIPILATAQRPRTGGSGARRPGTGQTRFSVEPPIAGANLRRALNSAGGRSRTFGAGEDQHNKTTCRQCFRAGFDCAVQLHNGQGTGARKALQEFVAAGGLEALSGVEDFYEGSIWGSQAMGAGASSKRAQAAPPIRGQNFVDRLGEVAFGESALSRPVTRGAMQDMLEERGRVLTEQQHSKTVEQFLMELQRLQKEQEEEFALQQEEDEQEDGEDARTRSKTGTTEKKTSFDQNAGYSSPQVEKNRSVNHVNEIPAMDEAQNEQPKEENASQYDQESLQSSATEDELPFLADRWSMLRKLHQLTVYAIWLFCIQCVSAGYSTSVPTIQDKIHAVPLSLNFGEFTFLLGQAGGLFFGACLSSLGRIRLPILSILMSVVVCVIIGFMHTSFVIIALRGALGYLTGLYEIALVGMILDLSTSRRQRFGFLIYVLVWIISAQAAGPWITALVIKVGAWPWLYWLTAIVGLVFMFFLAFITAETEACSIYRTAVKKLRVESAEAWTPEPRVAASWREIILIRSIRPFVMLVRHPIVILSTLLLGIPLASIVGVIDPISDVLQGRHQFASWKSTLLISICIALGLLIATVVILLFGVGSKRLSFSQRTRILFMDEKGIIDAQRPKFNAEQVLHVCVTGLIILTVGLYTLALTATITSWIFCGICLVLCVTGVTLLSVGLLHYIAESYYPAAFTILGEVLALSDSVGPAPQYADAQVQQRISMDADRTVEENFEQRQEEEEEDKDDHTLMSGANQDGKRWDSNWALNVIGTVLGFTMVLSGVATFIGRLAAFNIGFGLYVAILASIVLGISGLALLFLVRYGHKMRKDAFVHIAKTEQHIWQAKRPSGSDANISVATSTGVTRSRRSTTDNGFAFNRTQLPLPQPAKWKTGLKQFLLPTLRASDQIEEGGSVPRKPSSVIMDPTVRSKIRNWVGRQRGTMQDAQNGENREIAQISTPFNAQHISSGANLIDEDQDLYDAFGVQLSVRGGDQRSRRRSTLVNDGQMPSFEVFMKQKEEEYNRQFANQQQSAAELKIRNGKPVDPRKNSISTPAPITPTPKSLKPIASPRFVNPTYSYQRAQTPPPM
ncbi:MFS general substrate transporter [Meira miltonrushii]|uniref:MFS general substrate transporter n=1 Tax=Meira miltonrushii TaxID=1280837 RepID=A0A316VJB0_9BASI|nr:MFS general substrate transporter [Meira miltonrushii]PWN37148.1 MFS general substrate transporter [Meira miltonrushii]